VLLDGNEDVFHGGTLDSHAAGWDEPTPSYTRMRPAKLPYAQSPDERSG
jgi:hypothetical protein